MKARRRKCDRCGRLHPTTVRGSALRLCDPCKAVLTAAARKLGLLDEAVNSAS